MFEWYKRYGSPEMHGTWSTLNRIKLFDFTERMWLQQLVDNKFITKEEAAEDHKYLEAVTKACNERPAEILSQWDTMEKIHHGHEMIAFLHLLDGYNLRWLHFGLTSSDVMDTTLAYQIEQSLHILTRKAAHIQDICTGIGINHDKLITYGRTHGQSATPIPFGLKFTRFASQVGIYLPLPKNEHLYLSKNTGSVGTNPTGQSDSGMMCTQVVPRVAHASAMFPIVMISGIFDTIAKEIRNLSRVEINEVREGSDREDSSAMPTKRNPRDSEHICGLAKVVRALNSVLLENIALEHERDLTNSSSERVVFPTIFLLVDEMADTLIKVLKNLEVNKSTVANNEMKHRNHNELAYLYLILKGQTRDNARKAAPTLIADAISGRRTLNPKFVLNFMNFVNDYNDYLRGKLDKNWMLRFKEAENE